MTANPDYLKCSCQSCGGHIEFPVSAANAIVNCPHCGVQTTLVADIPLSNAPAADKRSQPLFLIAAVVLVLFLGLALVIVTFHLQKRPNIVSVSKQASPAVESSTQSAAPVPAEDAQSDFIVGKISLQKTEGSGLVYAIGSLKNILKRQRFGVKVELNLFNEQDQNIGTASDYAAVIEPGKEWQFKALLAQPGTVKATIADIKEQ